MQYVWFLIYCCKFWAALLLFGREELQILCKRILKDGQEDIQQRNLSKNWRQSTGERRRWNGKVGREMYSCLSFQQDAFYSSLQITGIATISQTKTQHFTSESVVTRDRKCLVLSFTASQGHIPWIFTIIQDDGLWNTSIRWCNLYTMYTSNSRQFQAGILKCNSFLCLVWRKRVSSTFVLIGCPWQALIRRAMAHKGCKSWS